MKKKLRIQIASAILAVILTAGLGTAALASSEPPRSGGVQITQPTGQPGGTPNDRTQTPSAVPEAGASAEVSGREPGSSAETPAASGTAQPGASAEPSDEPSAEPSTKPSAEPGAEPNGEASGGPGASVEPAGAPSGEPGEGPDAPGEERPLPENGAARGDDWTVQVRSFFEELFRRFLSIFGGGAQPSAAQPLQESVPFAAPEEGEPSTEPGASMEPGAPRASGEANDSGSRPGASGEMGGSSGEPASYAAANTVTADSTGASYASQNGDENAVLVSGDTVTITDATVTKTGSSAGESADFYGVNAGVLAHNGANLTIENADITTDGTHANGVFSYGSGTVVNISDSTVTTSAANSGGLMTTGGAALNAVNVTVRTAGNSSAAIRSDRGGGTVNVTEGSYSAAGVGSPAIYSTADITVTDAVLTAASSEAVVIEGGNRVTLVNDTVSGNNAKLNGHSTVKTNVLIYQSMSGDAAEGSSSFTMTGGSMTAGTGAMFHVTNITTEINLSGVDFTYAADSDVFLDASADAWGTSGRNGGNVTLNLDDQDITGVITADSVSSVAVCLKNGSTWTLTGDSYITSLSGDTSGIDLNGYTLYVGGAVWNG